MRTTEFDTVEEGNVPRLMSLPQMLGFEFEPSPQKSFLNCTRLAILDVSAQEVEEHLLD